MENRITSEEVARQMTKAIQLLLEWARQEMLTPSQNLAGKAVSEKVQIEHRSIPDSKKLLKATEVAELLQVSRTHAYNLMKRGEIPTIRIGSAVRVKQNDLEEFIKQSKEG